MVVQCLVEGNSLRSTTRITGVHRTTIINLLCDLGEACSAYQDKVFRNLNCRRIQCDEIWSFVYAKEKNASMEMKDAVGAGDVWTWTAIDPDSKLVPCWFIGSRDALCAYHFIQDLAGRLKNRIQLTTDGLKVYIQAIEDAFGSEIEYAMLIKIFGEAPKTEARYSPARCMGSKRALMTGKPEYGHVSTSHVERQNLTMRMSMRRFTRLTNAFSKKVENLEYAVALHFMYYNFARIHQTLRVTPAMEAGVSDHVWSVGEILGLLEK